MELDIKYNEEKNQILQETRGVNFKQVALLIEQNKLLDDLRHKNINKYSHQRIAIVKIKNYIYAVPYIFNLKKKEIFLKTIYASRSYTKKYLNKGTT